jgi:uncharacterized protein
MLPRITPSPSPNRPDGGWTEPESPELKQVAIICAAACVCLGIVQFVGRDTTYLHLFAATPGDTYRVLRFRTWWVGCSVVGFVALPMAVSILLRVNAFRQCNLSWQGFRTHYWIYVALYLAALPVILIVSSTPAFYSYYPMYAQAGRSGTDFALWESLYAGQFIAVEFFFRGFLVGGLGKYLGVLAVPVSVMPYMMVHFSKPWMEAYAAIAAGFVLGWLAWKTKSIWGGVFLHTAVAITVDVLALFHRGQLPWMHA